MIRQIATIVLALSAVLGVPVARAQSPALGSSQQKTVVLNDGSIYNGALVEMVPGDHLTLQLATGEIKRFEWSQIQASAGTPPPNGGGFTLDGAAATGAGVLAGMLNPGTPDFVHIHFRANDSQASLFRSSTTMGLSFGAALGTDFGFWSPVCHAPCDVQIDRRLLYSVQGPQLVSSPAFTLPQGDSLTLEANVGHQASRSVAVLLESLGGAALVAGATVLVFGYAQDTTIGAGSNDPLFAQMRQDAQSRQHDLLVAGGAVIGTGAAMIVAGIIVHVASRTTVNVPRFGRIARMFSPAGAGLGGAPFALHF